MPSTFSGTRWSNHVEYHLVHFQDDFHATLGGPGSWIVQRWGLWGSGLGVAMVEMDAMFDTKGCDDEVYDEQR